MGGRGTGRDTSGARTKIYRVLADAWKALALLVQSERGRGSAEFGNQVKVLAIVLLYADYAVAYSAKTADIVGDLSRLEGVPRNLFKSLWRPVQGSMGAFENLKNMQAVRRWHKDTGIQEIVEEETGLDLNDLDLLTLPRV